MAWDFKERKIRDQKKGKVEMKMMRISKSWSTSSGIGFTHSFFAVAISVRWKVLWGISMAVINEELECECGKGACILRISHSEKNPERKYWSCPLSKKGGDYGCGYFRWADNVSTAYYVRPFTPVVDEAHQCSSCSRVVRDYLNGKGRNKFFTTAS